MRYLLFPFSLIYGFVIWVRNFLFDFELLPVKEFDIPIVSIGNITVGGTGKTPHVEYLIEALQNDYNIAVLSRGYKRKTKGFVVVTENMDVEKTGDEPLQIKRKYSNCTVAVDEKRVRGINNLLSKRVDKKIDIILLDDAFQHRYVKSGLSVLLVDYNRLITKDHLLPYGRLREPAHEMRRANIILVTKCPDELKPIEMRILFKEFKTLAYQNLYYTNFKYQALSHLFKNEQIKIDSAYFNNSNILLVTAIANPDSLISFLEKRNKKIEHLKYNDHHYFTERDINRIIMQFEKIAGNEKFILTTEKDSIRLRDDNIVKLLQSLPVYYISIRVNFLNNDSEKFMTHIRQYASSNKRKQNVGK
ncbi:MAG: tetraacyldisaccharide 4'-kinase [Chlorobi bacterium]|nr:tetraacyldisaccharide 4'-kinase [Chlorobiota bacterium]